MSQLVDLYGAYIIGVAWLPFPLIEFLPEDKESTFL